MSLALNTLTLSAAMRFVHAGGSELPAACIALTPDEEARTVRVWQSLCGLTDDSDAAALRVARREVLNDGDLIAALAMGAADFAQWWAGLADEWRHFPSARGRDARAWGQAVLTAARAAATQTPNSVTLENTCMTTANLTSELLGNPAYLDLTTDELDVTPQDMACTLERLCLLLGFNDATPAAWREAAAKDLAEDGLFFVAVAGALVDLCNWLAVEDVGLFYLTEAMGGDEGWARRVAMRAGLLALGDDALM